jgi:hypothetical protein
MSSTSSTGWAVRSRQINLSAEQQSCLAVQAVHAWQDRHSHAQQLQVLSYNNSLSLLLLLLLLLLQTNAAACRQQPDDQPA